MHFCGRHRRPGATGLQTAGERTNVLNPLPVQGKRDPRTGIFSRASAVEDDLPRWCYIDRRASLLSATAHALDPGIPIDP
jgi:hypothetical protein